MLSVGIFGKVSNRLWFLRNSNGYQDSYRSGAVPKVSNVSVLLHSQQLGHSSVGRVAGNYHSSEMMAIQHTSSIPPQKKQLDGECYMHGLFIRLLCGVYRFGFPAND